MIKNRLVYPLIEDYIQRKGKILFFAVFRLYFNWNRHLDNQRTCSFATPSPYWELKMIIQQLRISFKEMSKILFFVVFRIGPIYFNWDHHLDKKKTCLHLTFIGSFATPNPHWELKRIIQQLRFSRAKYFFSNCSRYTSIEIISSWQEKGMFTLDFYLCFKWMLLSKNE